MGGKCGLNFDYIVGVHAIDKGLVVLLYLAGGIAQHVQPSFGMGLYACLQVPVPRACARTLQRQLPRVFRIVLIVPTDFVQRQDQAIAFSHARRRAFKTGARVLVHVF